MDSRDLEVEVSDVMEGGGVTDLATHLTPKAGVGTTRVLVGCAVAVSTPMVSRTVKTKPVAVT